MWTRYINRPKNHISLLSKTANYDRSVQGSIQRSLLCIKERKSKQDVKETRRMMTSWEKQILAIEKSLVNKQD
ncbi:MAG: hypothetical protein AB7P13_12325 [Candidatus Nitrosocosmicus sp.]